MGKGQSTLAGKAALEKKKSRGTGGGKNQRPRSETEGRETDPGLLLRGTKKLASCLGAFLAKGGSMKIGIVWGLFAALVGREVNQDAGTITVRWGPAT